MDDRKAGTKAVGPPAHGMRGWLDAANVHENSHITQHRRLAFLWQKGRPAVPVPLSAMRRRPPAAESLRAMMGSIGAMLKSPGPMSENLRDVTGSIGSKWFRPKTDVVPGENRYGVGRKQMWRRPKPLGQNASGHGKQGCRHAIAALHDRLKGPRSQAVRRRSRQF